VTRKLGTWSSSRGRKRRVAGSRVHSVGWAEQFRCRSQAAAPSGDRDPHSHAHRVLYPHSLTPFLSPPSSLLSLSTLSPPSLPLPRPRNLTSREAPHNPSGTRSYPESSRRWGPASASGVSRRRAVPDPGPRTVRSGGLFFGDGAVAGCWSGGSGPDVRVIRGNSLELRGAPTELGGGGNGEFRCPVLSRAARGQGSSRILMDCGFYIMGAAFSSATLVICAVRIMVRVGIY
jgi:hypothetical protein